MFGSGPASEWTDGRSTATGQANAHVGGVPRTRRIFRRRPSSPENDNYSCRLSSWGLVIEEWSPRMTDDDLGMTDQDARIWLGISEVDE